jgi:branched-chain amino acid transport system permease protein
MGKRNLTGIIVLALVIGILPQFIDDSYYIGVLFFVAIYSLITIGLSLLMGYAGQISLGHAAFYGIGAYTSGILTTRFELNGWLAMLIAVLLAGILALLIGIPTLRLKGHYLAMATLAFGVIVYVFFEAAVELTGGPGGLGGIPRLTLFGWKLKSDLQFYYLGWAFAIIVLGLALNIVHSRVGRALRSIHGSEVASRAMGVNTARLKVQIFVLSACLAALAGSLYSHYLTFVGPSTFDFTFSVRLVTMVAVGGMTSLWGAMAGTAFLAILPEYLSGFDEYYLLIYGGILVAIILFLPEGFLLGIGHGISRLAGWARSEKAEVKAS